MNIKSLGKYELHEHLGSGATADVYLALDTVLDRNVALKILKPALVVDPASFARFTKEAQAASNLFHPYIASVLDMGEDSGYYYIALLYTEGRSLDKLLKEQGAQSWDLALKMVEQIGSALEFAHIKGFLHRDIKPSNIIYTSSGDFVLTDFGLTRAMMSTGMTSHTGAMVGTPPYMAPEVWRGEKVTSATDGYALACVFYEILTGKVLFEGDTPPVVMTKHIMDGPKFTSSWAKDFPEGIEKVLRKSLAKAPIDRYRDMQGFEKALMSLIAKEEAEINLKSSKAKPVKAKKPIQGPSNTQTKQNLLQNKLRIGPFNVTGMTWIGIFGLVIVAGIMIWSTFVSFGQSDPSPLSIDPTPASEEQALKFSNDQPPDTIDAQGVPMVLVPAGEYYRGAYRSLSFCRAFRDDCQENWFTNSEPESEIYLDAFYIDQYEVTNGFYKLCMDVGICAQPKQIQSHSHSEYFTNSEFDQYPVIHIDWEMANSYCEWRGARLPTESEWQKAATNDGSYYFPWSSPEGSGPNSYGYLDCSFANFESEGSYCVGDTSAVGSYEDGVSQYGAYDMAGNVWEWTADWYSENYYQTSPYFNPLGPTSGELRVMRGGSWYNFESYLLKSYRGKSQPDTGGIDIGFRCARSAETNAKATPLAPIMIATLGSVGYEGSEIAEASTPVGTQFSITATQTPKIYEYDDGSGIAMLSIPAGEFIMGGESNDNEQPIHVVGMNAYYIDRYEVTNEQYRQCVNSGDCTPPKVTDSSSNIGNFVSPEYADYPVVYVNWEMANNYCDWRSARLPSEAEWEKAARGTGMRIYPWRSGGINCEVTNYNNCLEGTTQIGSYPAGASPYGALDMAGNVSEWVADWYSDVYYADSEDHDPKGPSTGDLKLSRGGSFSDGNNYTRTFNRNHLSPNEYLNTLGFRCARDWVQAEPTLHPMPESIPTPTVTTTPSPAATHTVSYDDNITCLYQFDEAKNPSTYIIYKEKFGLTNYSYIEFLENYAPKIKCPNFVLECTYQPGGEYIPAGSLLAFPDIPLDACLAAGGYRPQ